MIRHDDLYGRTGVVPERPLFAVTLLKTGAVIGVALIVVVIGLTIWASRILSRLGAFVFPGLFHAGRKDW